MRHASILLLALAICLEVAAAQVPSPRDAATLDKKGGTAVVRGRVTDAATGEPLSRVTVSLSLMGVRSMIETISDANGAYEFTHVAAGRYALFADPSKRTTHIGASYGREPGKPSGSVPLITVRDGDVFDKADIALQRSYVISGHVVDENGEPVADARVEAERLDVRGAPFSGGRSRSTDDRGAFRLWGFHPGTYRLCATPLSFGPDRQASEGPIRTCYPSAVESEAQPIVVTNADPPELEIRLQRSRFYRISGAVLDASGTLVNNARVSFVTVERGGSSSRTLSSEGGTFVVRGVSPGEYFVRAELGNIFNADDPNVQLGYTPVTVQSADVENVTVMMTTPATVRGRIVFDGDAPPGLSSLTVRQDPVHGSMASRAGPSVAPATVKPDLSFELRGLFGPQILQVDGARGWVVKSMKYRGEERALIPTDFKSQSDSATVEIVLTNRTARLVARVLDDKGQATEEGRVVVFPVDSRQWGGMNAARLAVARDGTFDIPGLRAAEYFVIAVGGTAPYAVRDQRTLEEFSKQAERIVLLENDNRTIDIALRR